MDIKKKRIIGYSILGLSLLLAILVTGVVGKYFVNKDSENEVTTEDFYFTVDLLGETVEPETLTREINLYGGNSKVLTFSVRNYFDSLRYSSFSNLKYNEPIIDSTSTYGAGDTSKANVVKGEKVTNGNLVDVPYTLNISSGYVEGDVINVVVKSTEPYKKTLTLKFVLHTTGAPVKYRLEDTTGSTYARLIIMSNIELTVGNMVVSWKDISSEISVDTTSEFVLDGLELYTNIPTEYNSSNGELYKIVITKTIKGKESIQIYFFKNDPSKNYSVSDTEAVLSDGKYVIELKNN